MTNDPTRKAEILSQHFQSNFTFDNLDNCNVRGHRSGQILDNVDFTAARVEKALNKLKTKTAGGPDGVSPLFLKRCKRYLSAPLAIMFGLFFEHSFLPFDWLLAYVSPIFKKGDSSKPSNYRPISLTCTLCKIMESIIKDEVLHYLVSNNAISRRQHAFIQRHSTVTNLLECSHDWVVCLHDHHSVDVAYVDFSRAFDSVVHRKLLMKLESSGVCGKLLAWIAAFLSGRQQCVVVEGFQSDWSAVVSGVPQGSVLGPILFLVFINDVTDDPVNKVSLSLFADDLKLYSSIDKSDDCLSLQCALDKLAAWSSEWQLNVNIEKTYILHIGSINSCAKYYYNGNEVKSCTSIRDLGVTVDSKMNFDRHIENIVRDAYIRVGVLFNGFISRDLNLMKKAYTTFIRPVIEYASSVWCPYKQKHIVAIEKVQRHFTRRIPALRDLSYGERLGLIELETLELRRLKCDLILYYKILTGISPLSCEHYFNYVNHGRSTRLQDKYVLQKPFCRNKLIENDFFVRRIDCWNSLPDNVKHCDSLYKFKRFLSTVDLSSFLVVKL